MNIRKYFWNRHLVRMTFKNGTTQDFWCFRFDLCKENIKGVTTLTEIKWIMMNPHAVLFMRMEDIDAIFQIESNRGLFGEMKYDSKKEMK